MILSLYQNENGITKLTIMKKYTPAQKIYIDAYKVIAKGSRKYEHFIDMPLKAEAKQILKELGFKGKYLN